MGRAAARQPAPSYSSTQENQDFFRANETCTALGRQKGLTAPSKAFDLVYEDCMKRLGALP